MSIGLRWDFLSPKDFRCNRAMYGLNLTGDEAFYTVFAKSQKVP